MEFDHSIHLQFYSFVSIQCHKKLLFVTRLNKDEVDHDPDFCSVDDITDFGLPSRRRLPQILSSHGFETHESHLRRNFFIEIPL